VSAACKVDNVAEPVAAAVSGFYAVSVPFCWHATLSHGRKHWVGFVVQGDAIALYDDDVAKFSSQEEMDEGGPNKCMFPGGFIYRCAAPALRAALPARPQDH